MDAVQVVVEYAAFHTKGGLSFEGLKQTYEDGIGDVDTDYETLGLFEPVSILSFASLIYQKEGGNSVTTVALCHTVCMHVKLCIDYGIQECHCFAKFYSHAPAEEQDDTLILKNSA